MGNNELLIWHGTVYPNMPINAANWRVLNEAERQQAGKFKFANLQQRYIEVHGCLRHILAQILNESPEVIRINKTTQGKPYLVDYPDVVFNLSHSADSWAIAIGWQCQLGIDLEVYHPRTNLSGLVGRCFGKEESAYWYSLPAAEQTLAFYRFWTRKEAFVKATGLGITLGLNRCIINPQQPAEFLSIPDNCGDVAEWSIADIELGDRVCCALVVDKQGREIRLREFVGE